MQKPLHAGTACYPKPENITVVENGLYCGACGHPLIRFEGMGKTDIARALLLYFQTPCITASQKGTDALRPFP